MPEATRLGLDAAGELHLRQSLLEQPGDEPADRVGDGRRGADALDLPSRLDRPLADDVAADVLEARARKEILKTPEPGDRQHVELETDAPGDRAVAPGDELRKLLGRRQIDDRAERRLEAGALGDLAHEEGRLALRRDVQVRLLDGPGVVEEIGVLQQEGGVEAAGREAGLQAGDTARELVRRRERRAGLHQRGCLRGGHLGPVTV